MSVYDVLIIGAGPGGYVAAEEAARLGKKVAVVEKKSIGGTCLNVGCIPSKAYLQHGHWLLTMEEARRYGIESKLERIDFEKLVDRKNQVVASLQSGIHASFKSLGIEYIEGQAKFVKDRTFSVNGKEISGKDVILATGSYPFVPPIKGLERVNYLTTDTFFYLRELPEKLVIIGGGVIAIELAFAMAPLGVAVTVIEVAPEILLTEEAEARHVIQKKLKKMGVMIYQGAQIKEVTGNSVLLENEQVAFDHQVVDGQPAAEFLASLADKLESPYDLVF